MEGLKFRDWPLIPIAKSVRGVASLENEYARLLMDRNKPIEADLICAIVAQSVMDWREKSPTPALDSDGNIRGTGLDMFSVLVPMAARRAVIEIPDEYCNRRQVVVKPNERKIGTSRFGPIIGLVSNKDVFSFSVKILDYSIITTDPNTEQQRIGAPKSFMIVDCDGYWYDGLKQLVLDPNREENRFFIDRRLTVDNTLYFRYYVHPNRWQSVFGAPYLLEKMASIRIKDEASFYRQEVKRLLKMGIRFPARKKKGYVYIPPPDKGPKKRIMVDTLEMVLDIPEFSGTHPQAPDTQEGLVWAYRHHNLLAYTLGPLVQFSVRANEAAYFRYGDSPSGPKIAHWMQGRTWKPGWKAPRGRAIWHQMVLGPNMALRWREKAVFQLVSAE